MKYQPENKAHRIELAKSIITMLDTAGFQKISDNRIFAKELVYGREVQTSRVWVLIYTSIVGNEVRDKDSDAIRVASVYIPISGKIKPLASAEGRVYRTGELGDISERTLKRMREVWSKSIPKERCQCGAPKILSSKGKLYCAEICWENKVEPEVKKEQPRKCYRCGGPATSNIVMGVIDGHDRCWHIGCH